MIAGRPILVWLFLAASIALACYGGWALFQLLRMGAISITDFGSNGFLVSTVPAIVMVVAALCLVALTRWAILAAVLNLLVVTLYFFVESVLSMTVVWFALSIGMLGYAIWLRRVGTLT